MTGARYSFEIGPLRANQAFAQVSEHFECDRVPANAFQVGGYRFDYAAVPTRDGNYGDVVMLQWRCADGTTRVLGRLNSRS